MKIKIKYHTDIDKIAISKNGDWVDLRASKTVHLKTNEFALIPLGVSIKLPKGCEAYIVPRSSTFKNWGVIQTNGMGIIDNSYCGNDDMWMMPVLATRDTTINKNDRICQFRINGTMGGKFPLLELEECSDLSANNRGGFGSSGIS